ncbi:Pac2p KNAG_0L00810 [Huiozyma naganishii CBS 8797]|uniref:CAP-Gly domain-containing protein n=1 Tax=Huiozyma naganishii (strain ATCC MYA-139 / BCRC 22969 / CBS 8797 / KCTC 17520 / NBRC 10181 / NCYC 3082 / Yp74L-3) TaxID=1071383 RepID=J7S3L9_HUIN7|nr:hypothetical protein KNAG_0L00810 [Kazachstania naganishii CBS 8797]CCK72702.1 hypothetical protein KNAG_0L00810 [Kazachstania naganishii CBS 8797]
MPFAIGERFQIKNDICTIRYIGIIDRWPDVRVYGVEWDNVSRGKNSGSVDGKKYFETACPGSGSFIKESKFLRDTCPTYSFLEALFNTYFSCPGHDSTLAFGSKEVEYCGFEQLDSRNHELKSLNTISLNKQCINVISRDPTDREKIARYCGQVQTLDIGMNLLIDLELVLEILVLCTQAEELNLSGNRFQTQWNLHSRNQSFPQVKRLYMISCTLTDNDIAHLFEVFPSIELLDVSMNDLTSEAFAGLTLPPTLKDLILHGNAIEWIPKNILSSNIQNLDLSSNLIGDESVDKAHHSTIRYLDLTCNKITTWELLGKLNSIFTDLISLKILDNPLYSGKGSIADEEDMLYETVVRMGQLSILDGSDITEELRNNAELYVASKVVKSPVTCDEVPSECKIFANNQAYEEGRCPVTSWLEDELIELKIIDKESSSSFLIHVLRGSTLRSLKGIISSKLRTKIAKIQLLRTLGESDFEVLDKDFSSLDNSFLDSGDIVYTILKGRQ